MEQPGQGLERVSSRNPGPEGIEEGRFFWKDGGHVVSVALDILCALAVGRFRAAGGIGG